MNPTGKFDDRELERERWFKSELGAELLGFIDGKTEPWRFELEDEEEDAALDLRTMGLAPFVTRDGVEDEF